MTESNQPPMQPIINTQETGDGRTRTTVRIKGLDPSSRVPSTYTGNSTPASSDHPPTVHSPAESRRTRRTVTVPQAVGAGAVGSAVNNYTAPRGTALPGTTLFEGKISNVVKVWSWSERKRLARNTMMPIKPKKNKISGVHEFTEESNVWKEAKKRMKRDAVLAGVFVGTLALTAFAVTRDGSDTSNNTEFSRVVPIESADAQAGIGQTEETTPESTTPGGFNPEFTTESDTGRFSRDDFENAFDPETATDTESTNEEELGETGPENATDLDDSDRDALIASFTGAELIVGSTGEQVSAAQQGLVEAGCLDEDGVDGTYGVNTETAVKRAQAEAGIEDDGRFGGNTQERVGTMIRLGSKACGADVDLEQ